MAARVPWWQVPPSESGSPLQVVMPVCSEWHLYPCGVACCFFPFKCVFVECVSRHLCLPAALVDILPQGEGSPQPSSPLGYVLHREVQLLEAYQAGSKEVFLSASVGVGHHIHKCQCSTEAQLPPWALWC